jgi:hypothetical protein
MAHFGQRYKPADQCYTRPVRTFIRQADWPRLVELARRSHTSVAQLVRALIEERLDEEAKAPLEA